jgi:hypothetical protein
MSGLPAVSNAERFRARRWDVLILGSGLPSLVAAARLGMAGHRVLVVEEDAARALHPAMREPFYLAGSRDQGVLDALVRELKIPLIDQRRIESERLAYQVVSPKFRMDLGGPGVTAHELVAWGFCDRGEAGGLVRSLVEATEAERKVMLTTSVVRLGRRLGLPRITAQGAQVRGLPGEVAQPSDGLGALFDAQVSALSNLATGQPSPEARARLLGSGLAGGSGFADGPPWLHGLVRRRVESVYGEFRTVAGKFGMVSVDGQPALQIPETGELWVGRVLLVGAATSALTGALIDDELPRCLGPIRPHTRRVAMHFRVSPEIVPQGMCPRVVLMREAQQGLAHEGVITLTASADLAERDEIDLVGRMRLGTGQSIEDAEREISERVQALMPFSTGRLTARPIRRPVWDDDDWLEDPVEGAGWPAEIELRVSSKPAVHHLDRAGVAGLGFEGDLLLGWRAGDAVAAELG